MLVSIIVPVYNVENYLSECLESLINQTYQKIEIIVVDDGSSDTSGQICDRYAKKYDNIKVIHKKNEGLGMARNTGLEHINGDYVTFLDSDDFLDKDFIEALVEAIKNTGTDVCKSGFKRVDINGNLFHEIKYEDEIFEESEAKTQFLPRLIGSSPEKKDSIEMAVCATLYNANVIRMYGLKFPSERKLISEDLVFNIDYMQYANGACTISKLGYNYRFNTNSLSTKYREDRFEASCFFYKEIKRKLETLGYDINTIFRLQRIFFINTKTSIYQEKSSISQKTKRESVNRVREICNNEELQNILKEYPIRKLGFSQKMFLYLLRHRMARLLYLYFEYKD